MNKKKTLLLSIATATALTFGVTSYNAKAEGLQPSNQSTTCPAANQFANQSINQQDLQTLLNQVFGKLGFAKVITLQPGNYNLQDVLNQAQAQITQQTQQAPAQNTQQAPAQNTQQAPAQNTQQAPAQKAQQAPAQKAQQAPAQKAQQAPAQKAQQAPAQNTQQAPAQNTQQAPAQKAPAQSSQSGVLSAYEQKVVDLTNAERQKAGLPALQVDPTLSKVAKAKSQDMNNLNYFDHTSPTYGSPFDMMKQFGITYTTAGENIAEGQATPEEVVQAWMASPGHRANILNNTYTYIGVGYVSGKNIWTQEFISK